MNEHEQKELEIMIDSIGWDKFKEWISESYLNSNTVYCASLTDLGSVLEREQLIGAHKYLKEAIGAFESFVTNINK